ncbi:MAG: 6-carboxytetrahydropterin synthase QueD [Nitrospinae bacterium CG11_big_fil_rev_8_21_14_0_20_45_15]|nr:MAG: 6-carboxytetrahydropterin synthase QueD [Nitrospinae bacterium CG11_big_fil_rev_8_21_14_0_20_45_15]
MFEVTIRTTFSAAHQLKFYDGKYENLHGHNWIAVVTASAKELDAIGLGIDFVKLRELTDEILSVLDYKNLNEVPPFDKMNPSAENIAQWLFEALKPHVNNGNAQIRRVEIKEFEHSGASYFEDA